MNFFRNLDRFSFWIGFLAGTLTWWFISTVRPVLREARERLQENLQRWREGVTRGTEVRLRQDMLVYAQRSHVAASLCPLDALLIPPALLVPPVYALPEEEETFNAVGQVLPYLPDWPELGAVCNAPQIRLDDALSNGANIVIVGEAGYGKTVALAALASRMARQEALPPHLEGRLPLLIHVHDLPLDKAPLDAILEGLYTHTSLLTQAQLPKLLRTHIEHSLLLLDGLDELPPAQLEQAAGFLKRLLEAYPGIQVVTTATPRDYDGLTRLGFFPLAINTWNPSQQQAWLEKWRAMWHTLPQATEEVPDEILRGWLYTWRQHTTPLEYTVSMWALFAGDALGNTPLDALEAHVRRLYPQDKRAEMARRIWDTLTQGKDTDFTEVAEESTSSPQEDAKPKKTEPPQVVRQHPVFSAYLVTGHILENDLGEVLFGLPASPLKELAQQYYAAQADITPYLPDLLESREDPLLRDTLRVARWLRLTPREAAWRPTAMRVLAQNVQRATLPLGLRLRCVAALALSGDSGVGTLLARLMENPSPTLRYLGALGSSLLRDPRHFSLLESLLQDSDPRVQRAACLGMGALSHPKAMESIAAVLVGGDEMLQQLAAETLAANRTEGHEILREAMTFDDLLVRRAAVAGLLAVHQPWAEAALRKMQMEDSEWVVRTAAEQALKQLEGQNPYIPQPQTPLRDTPWLLAYAAEQGRGIASEEQGLETLVHMLQHGNVEQRLTALQCLRMHPDLREGGVAAIYALLYGDDTDLQEAALETLWHLAAARLPLPPPMQFGFE